MSTGSANQEYQQLNENMRHYGNMRFAQLTLYFAFTAALVAAIFTTDPPLTAGIRVTLKHVGMIGSIAFGVMEERATCYWHSLYKRAVKLESALGYEQHSNRPAARFLSATSAVRLLIWGGSLLWFLSIAIDLWTSFLRGG